MSDNKTTNLPHAKGMHPGAIWRKADLQVHSPRDPQWNGGPHFPGGSAELDAERDAWADCFIRACIEKNLGIVALTDHHDMCAVPYILKAIARLPLNSPKPWVFPGMEVTCDDSAQCLVIFSLHTDAQLWNRLYGGHLLKIQLPDPDAATNPQAIPCGRNVDDFLEEISNDIHLAPHLIVLPNAGNSGSHKTIIRQGFAARFRDLSFDGVYLDKGYSQLDDVTRKKIYGQIIEWGSRRRGIIPTGDNRTADFANLGGHDCWIKLGEPTAEGLRQAVLADEARIAYSTPEFPSQRVIELNITSTLCGKSFRLLLNDGFNAVIGGRGSGKSAILEYLRFGVGRSTGDVTNDQDEESDRQRNLIADTLSNGSVSVVLERDGVREIWTRYGVDSSVIQVLISGAEPEQITIEAAQQRFRARAFSQKQLSTLVNSRRLASQQITGIAAAESIDRRQSLEQDITKSKRSVTTAFQRVVQLWTAEADLATSVGLVQDLERRRDAIKKKLEESGLSTDKQLILEQAPTFKSAQTMFSEVKESIATDQATVQSLVGTLPTFSRDSWTKAELFPEVVGFIDESELTKIKVDALLNQCIDELRTLEQSRETFEAAFALKLNEFVPRYKDVREQQASLKSLMEESTRIEKELEAAERQNRKNKEAVASLSGAKDELTLSRFALQKKLTELQQVLSDAASQVSSMSGGLLRAQVQNERVPKQHVDALSKLCENQRVRDVGTKCEDRVKSVIMGQNGWDTVVDSLMKVYEARVKGSRTFGTPAVSAHTIGDLENILFALTPQQAQGIYASLDDSRVSALLTAMPEAFISFEYKDAGKFIAFEKASHGQQAAALLHLLLKQEAGTLIIDQPEDDLDNKVIMNIVKLVTTAKSKRQLIFSTHNANFVVNGDADKVISLASGNSTDEVNNDESRIMIEVDGAIETLAVRNIISDTVEGGREAFELRSRKYLFTK